MYNTYAPVPNVPIYCTYVYVHIMESHDPASRVLLPCIDHAYVPVHLCHHIPTPEIPRYDTAAAPIDPGSKQMTDERLAAPGISGERAPLLGAVAAAGGGRRGGRGGREGSRYNATATPDGDGDGDGNVEGNGNGNGNGNNKGVTGHVVWQQQQQ